jgi:ankyrin repeat protein
LEVTKTLFKFVLKLFNQKENLMSEQRNYMAEIQALIDQKWKENPEEMKRVMADIKAKEKKEKEKPKVETPKRVSFDPQLTQELIEELNKDWDNPDVSKNVDASKIKYLIERGADLETKNNKGRTPLHWASTMDCIEIAKLLLDRGADVGAKDKWGLTPLDWASYKDNIELAKLLLDAGADVEAKDVYGRTPLHWACSDEMRDLLKKYMK